MTHVVTSNIWDYILNIINISSIYNLFMGSYDLLSD